MIGYIYKIQHCTEANLCYIGSTFNFLNRQCQHIRSIKDETCQKRLYIRIRATGGVFSYTISIIEEFETDKLNLRLKENHYINELKPALNHNRAFTTPEEKADAVKEYYIKHRESLLIKKKSKITCECGCLLSRSNPYTHRNSKKHFILLSTLAITVS
jgi:predicted GIY-YIG superfamily endonuclease